MNAEVIPSAFPSIHDEIAANQSIGDIIKRTNNLSAEEVERILSYQREHGVKFGEAAVALGLAQQEDVLWALAQQFHYPYTGKSSGTLSEELVVANKPFCDQSEIFRGIRDQLITTVYQDGELRRRAVAVVSPESGDGKSFFVANMAVAMAQMGGRTLLVDADMRSPRQHEIFNVDNKSGLSAILAGRSEGNVLRHVQDYPGLYVLPVGIVPPNPLELLQRPSFGMLMSELVGKFDHVIVDTPSAAQGVDARVIAAVSGAAVGVVRKGKTRTESINVLLAPLIARKAIKMVGIVMNEY
jgi:protein-tyrosine kinase